MMETRRPVQASAHFNQLDSLRGLAALSVALHHWHILWRLTPHSSSIAFILQIVPFRLLIAGHAAVMMFFVLSGFVLSLPQVSGKRVVYRQYFVKRVCRIYLPYLVALSLSLLACWKWHGMHTYGAWIDNAWPEAPKLEYILQHLAFLGSYNSARYNIAFWTLVHEMRISLIFPFLCFVVLRFRVMGSLLIILAMSLLDLSRKFVAIVPNDLYQTCGYLTMFVLGILLARYWPCLKTRLRRLNAGAYWALLGACVFVYAYAPTLFNYLALDDPIWDLTTATGAAGIILYSLVDPRIKRFLCHTSIMFLGKISYSVYLLHAPILFIFAYYCYGRVPPFGWLVPYLAVTIGLATLMHKFVEEPSIKLGKLLALHVGLR